MSTRRPERGLLAALAVWGIGPLVIIALHAAASGQRLTGADGIIAGDQLQYLAWIQDASRHGLAASLFTLEPPTHVFAQPMFTLSAAVTALGAPLVLAYLLWKPVAVFVLFLGVDRLAARAFPGAAARRTAATWLALFCFLPWAALSGWTAPGAPGPSQSGLLAVAGELFPAGELWGYLPSAVAVGLLALALLATERGLTGPLEDARRPLMVAALAGLVSAWLHPWQGITFELILAGLAAWERRRVAGRLALPAIATGLPLLYYEMLSRSDPAWHLASRNEIVPHLPLLALLAGLGPPLIIACTGIRRPDGTPFERSLLLWVPAGLVTYFALGSFPAHGLEGLSIPLAVLMVRGWHRLRAPTWAGAPLLLVTILPGLLYVGEQLADVARSSIQGYYVSVHDARALDWVAHRAPRGGVLARPLFALAVPAQTGRAVWVGHQFWSRDYAHRAPLADALFAGRLPAPTARTLVELSGARLLVADCGSARGVVSELAPVLVATHRFGCASVSIIAQPGARTS